MSKKCVRNWTIEASIDIILRWYRTVLHEEEEEDLVVPKLIGTHA